MDEQEFHKQMQALIASQSGKVESGLDLSALAQLHNLASQFDRSELVTDRGSGRMVLTAEQVLPNKNQTVIYRWDPTSEGCKASKTTITVSYGQELMDC